MIYGKFKSPGPNCEIRTLQMLSVLILLAFAFSTYAAEPITLSSSASATQVTVGDQFTCTLTAEWDATKIQVVPPDFGEKLGIFEIIGSSVRDERPPNPAYSRKIWTLTLAAFESGDHTIPPIPLTYKVDQKTEKKAQFDGLTVKVLSGLDPKMNPGEPHPLKPPMAIAPDPRYRNRVLMILGGALFLAAAVGLLVWRLKRKKPVAEAAIVDHRTPEEIAFDQLDALLAAGLIEQGQFKAFYTTLSDILRAYLGRKYNFDALEMTTHETMDALSQRIVSVHLSSRIEELLNEADMAKFAKWTPAQETCRRSIDSARRLIQDLMTLSAPKSEPEVLAQ